MSPKAPKRRLLPMSIIPGRLDGDWYERLIDVDGRNIERRPDLPYDEQGPSTLPVFQTTTGRYTLVCTSDRALAGAMARVVFEGYDLPWAKEPSPST